MSKREYHDYNEQRSKEDNDSFLYAFGNKPGSDRRKQRRQRKGWEY